MKKISSQLHEHGECVTFVSWTCSLWVDIKYLKWISQEFVDSSLQCQRSPKSKWLLLDQRKALNSFLREFFQFIFYFERTWTRFQKSKEEAVSNYEEKIDVWRTRTARVRNYLTVNNKQCWSHRLLLETRSDFSSWRQNLRIHMFTIINHNHKGEKSKNVWSIHHTGWRRLTFSALLRTYAQMKSSPTKLYHSR